MKKIITLLLVMAMLATTGAAAFAEEDDTQRPTIEDLFDTYNPSAKQTYLDLKAEHEAFHTAREEVKQSRIQEYAAQVETVAGNVADGTITIEEARTQIDALRAEVDAIRAEFDVLQEQKQAENQAIKDERTAVKALLKNALTQDEVIASEVAGYLEQVNDLLRAHIDIDYKYAALVDELLQ